MMSIVPLFVLALIALQDPPVEPPKPAESTPVETKPAAQDPAEPAPADPKPADPTSAESKSTDAKGADPKVTDTKLDESRTDATKNGAPKPAEKPKDGPSSLDERLAAEGWEEFDRVALIVNHKIITRRQVMAQMKRMGNNRSRAEDPRNLQLRVLGENVNRALASQAGNDLGADEKMVDMQVKNNLDRWITNHNGVVEAGKLLDSMQMTTQEFRKELRERLYERMWREWVTGVGTGVGDRPQNDRFVRPGMLLFRYEAEVRDPAKYSVLGGTSETCALQRLILDPEANGGLEKTIQLANQLRQRIIDEDNMTELVQSFGMNKDDNGIERDLNVAHLKKLFPDLGAYAEKAQPGDVSEPMPLKNSKRTFVQIARMLDKKAAVKPELSSPEVQIALTKAIQDELDGYRLMRAFGVLYESAYIWPEEIRDTEKP